MRKKATRASSWKSRVDVLMGLLHVCWRNT